MKSEISYASLDQYSRVKKGNKIVRFLNKFTDLKCHNVLDIGTGSGYIAHVLSKQAKSVTSIDIIDERRITTGYKFKKVKDGHLPFKDNSFDVIVSNHLIEHLPDQEIHIPEIFRVLKKGGIAYLATSNKYWLYDPHHKLLFISWLPRKLSNCYLRIFKNKEWDIYPLSFSDINKLVKDKFKVINVTPLNVESSILSWLIKLLTPFVPAHNLILKSKKKEMINQKKNFKIKKTIFLKEATSLTDYLIELTKNTDIPLEYTDLTTNKNFGNVMVGDFGDYLPFVGWLGKIINKKYSDWAEQKSIFIIKKFQMPNGLLYTPFNKTKKVPKKNNLKTFSADKMSDSILGINLMYDLTKNLLFKKSLETFFSGLKRNMTSKKGFIYYKKNPLFHYPLSAGKYCGLYIEELSKLYESTKLDELLYFAKRMSYTWINDPFFKSNKLFPFKCTSPAIKPFAQILFKKLTSFTFETSMLTKSNTNLIFGLTRLQAIIKEEKINSALNAWVDALESKLLTKENILLSIWQENKKFYVTYLGADHAVIDALLDIYLLNSNKKALELATKITDGWLKLQSNKGLVIETPRKYDASKLSKLMKNYAMLRTDISRLDSQTDFAVVVLKIYELTKNKKYLEAAKNITKGIIKHHKHKKGFVEFVNVENGEKKGHTIETKFLFLLLKLFILMHEFENGKRIYKNKLLKDIIRDR